MLIVPRINLARFFLVLPGVAVMLYLGLLVMEGRIADMVERVVTNESYVRVAGVIPFLDGFHVSTIQVGSPYGVKLRQYLMHGNPFDYADGHVEQARAGSLTFSFPVFQGEQGGHALPSITDTKALYELLSANTILLPHVMIELDLPGQNILVAKGGGKITTDWLDEKETKHLRISFSMMEETVSLLGDIKASLTKEGVLEGEINIKSVDLEGVYEAVDIKRARGVIGFEKRPDTPWIFHGEGTSGFMRLFGQSIQEVTLLYLGGSGESAFLVSGKNRDTGQYVDIQIDRDGTATSIQTDFQD